VLSQIEWQDVPDLQAKTYLFDFDKALISDAPEGLLGLDLNTLNNEVAYNGQR